MNEPDKENSGDVVAEWEALVRALIAERRAAQSSGSAPTVIPFPVVYTSFSNEADK